jgi:glucokinase
MRILAADIGGTNARFSVTRINHRNEVTLGSVFTMPTRQTGVGSFPEFWKAFERLAPAELGDRDSFDAISLALAGSVIGNSAVLPNIDWGISAEDVESFHQLFLLNDFVAQGFALTAPESLEGLEVIRMGEIKSTSRIALVGAGTGLGHCSLIPTPGAVDGRYTVISSEAGHAGFSFSGEQEKSIEQKMLRQLGKNWLSNDDVVSGPGVALLHQCLTGEKLTPAEALEKPNSATRELFSRFYARACRNFCLNIFPVSQLVISGGLAARNPELVRSRFFTESFNDGQDYGRLLAKVPISLNTDQHFGIIGAAIYACRCLRNN